MQVQIPQAFKDYAARLLGAERYRLFEAALGDAPSVSVRLNPFKAHYAAWKPEQADGYDAPVPWASGSGFYLRERPAFTFDPLFHAGVYYVQEAASTFLEVALRRYVTRPVVALDLCAAPGGKSTHLRSLLPEGSLLVSNEPIRPRAQVLVENLTKWGHPDVVVTQSYPADFAALHSFFDLLVTDVPCSGEGMFRKEEEAVTGWSMDQVMMCRERQREILRDVWPSLRPGGLLLYSTCTLNSYEDEENVAWIARELGAEVLPLEVEPDWGIVGDLWSSCSDTSAGTEADAWPVYHFIQGLARGEGFFMAVLRKKGEDDAASLPVTPASCGRSKGGKKEAVRTSCAVPSLCKSWLRCSGDFDFRMTGQELGAVRTVFADRIGCLQRAVKVLQAGIRVATLKGKDWTPLHALAMSVELNPDVFPAIAADRSLSVAYLRKESLVLPAGTPKGYVLLTFRGVPLGFVKNIGTRANNLYPPEWKIRTAYLPDAL